MSGMDFSLAIANAAVWSFFAGLVVGYNIRRRL